jgi:hypothetical protein
MVKLGARMTAGIGGTHKKLWFTWLVRLESGGIDATRCDHVRPPCMRHILYKFNLCKFTISRN